MISCHIGRGKVMSIPKAAVIEFYENHVKEKDFIYYGDLDFMHDVIHRAGAKHVGPMTTFRVCDCLRQSDLWESKFMPGFLSGFRGHGGATSFEPSEKGKQFYQDWRQRNE
jgi:hypothetical protein